jgi:hypothetical protein
MRLVSRGQAQASIPQCNEFQCPVESLSAACLEQEPGTPLPLVNPNFDQAGSSNVLVFLADAMASRRARRVPCCPRNSASMSSGSTDEASLSVTRCQRAMWPMDLTVVPPELADTLRDRVGHGEELINLFVQ